MKSIEEEESIVDHVDWCSKQKFGVNNFGIYPEYLPLSKIKFDEVLHMI